MALRNLGIKHEVVAISEIDKYAIASYEAIHGETPNVGDISKIRDKDIPDCDLFTYSFPCQDISTAGNGRGLEKGSGTRSSLLWECERIIRVKRPRFLLLENVKNLVGKKNKPHFDEWLNLLESYGYKNFWKVLNAKDYNIPQNRERVFVVSVLTTENISYKFPEPKELKHRLKDILEKDVDDRYYLSDEQVNRLTFTDKRVKEAVLKRVSNFDSSGKRIDGEDYDTEGLTPTLTTDKREGVNDVNVGIGQLLRYDTERRQNTNRFRVYEKLGCAPTLDAMQGGNRQPHVVDKLCIKNATKRGYLEAEAEAEAGDGIDTAYPDSKTRRGRVQKGLAHTLTTDDSKAVVVPVSVQNETQESLTLDNKEVVADKPQQMSIFDFLEEKEVLGIDAHPFSKKMEFRGYSQSEVSPCILATESKAPKTVLETKPYHQKSNEFLLSDIMTIRKLTPLECWRLMGFKDNDYYKAESVVSNTQLYKQAGNSIVVSVLEGIFEQLFKI